MATDELNKAIESLRIREGIGKEKMENKISSVTKEEETADEIKLSIKNWLVNKELDAAIWTNLPPRINNQERIPSEDEVIAYLRSLDINKMAVAEEYIRRTPRQIDTDYRRRIEKEFGWTFKD